MRLAPDQKTIRADLYQNVVDHAENGDAEPGALGRRVVLPASFQGGGRFEVEKYQDCLGLTRTYGKPSLFITVTCNPKWPEITRALYEGQTSTDRPDVVWRVFHARSKLLNKRLRGPNGISDWRARTSTPGSSRSASFRTRTPCCGSTIKSEPRRMSICS